MGKRPQPRLRIDALTGDWRNGEAGKGRGGEDITWPDQVAPRGRKASSTRKIKPQTSNLKPYSHTEGRLLPYDAEAAPVLARPGWVPQSSATTRPCPRPRWTRCSSSSTRRTTPWRVWWDAGSRPRRGRTRRRGTSRRADDTLAACAPAAYQADAARHGIRSEAALRLTEEQRGVAPGFRPPTQGQLQKELERQAAGLEEDIRQLRALLAADRKRAIKDFWRRHAPDIAQR